MMKDIIIMDFRAILVGKVFEYIDDDKDELILKIMQDDKYYCEIRTKNIHKYTNSNGEIEIDEGKNYVFEVKIQAVDFEYSRAKDDLEELDDKDENYMNKYKRIIDDSIIIFATEIEE